MNRQVITACNLKNKLFSANSLFANNIALLYAKVNKNCYGNSKSKETN